jgi:WD40 repeat protein
VNDFAARTGAAEQLAAPTQAVRTIGWRTAVRDDLRAVAASPVAARNAERLRNLLAAAESRIDLEEVESVGLPCDPFCVALSPDGKRLAFGDQHGALVGASAYVRDRDGTTHKIAVTDGLMTSSNGIRALGFSPDGRWLVVGSRGGRVLVWDMAAPGQSPRTLAPAHKREVTGLTFTRDGTRLITASRDMTLAAWDTATWERAFTHTCAAGHEPLAVECSAAGDSLYVGHTRGGWVFRTADIKMGGKLDGNNNDNQFYIDRNLGLLRVTPGDEMCVGAHGSDLLLYGLHVRYPTQWLRDGRSEHAHADSVKGLSVDRTGTLLASGSSDNYLKLWDVSTGSLLLRLYFGGYSGVLPVFDPQTGDLLVVANRRLIRYRVVRAETVRTVGTQRGANVAVAFAGDSDTVATVRWELIPPQRRTTTGELAVWRISDGSRMAHHLFGREEGDVEMPPAVAADAAGTLVCGGMPRAAVMVWDWKNSSPPKPMTLPTPGKPVCSFLRFSPGGDRLWGLGEDSLTVRCITWPGRAEVLAKADTLLALVADRSSCTAVAVGRSWTAVGSLDCTVKLIPAADPGGSWRVLRTGDRETVHSVAISPDESLILAGTRNGKVMAFPLAGGDGPAEVLHRHQDRVEAIAFAPDGGILATGGRDDTIRLWQRTGGTFRPLVTYHTIGPVTQLAFSPDGLRLAFVVEGQRAFNVWEVGRFRAHLERLGLGW